MHHMSVLKLIKSEPLARAALAVPALGTLAGSLLLVCGGTLPCLIMDAMGLLLGLLLFIAVLVKYLWIEHLLLDGEEIEGKLIDLKDNPGIALAQTTELEYQYRYGGVEYKKRILVHLPENEWLDTPTILVDPDHPDSSIIKELYCVSAR